MSKGKKNTKTTPRLEVQLTFIDEYGTQDIKHEVLFPDHEQWHDFDAIEDAAKYSLRSLLRSVQRAMGHR